MSRPTSYMLEKDEKIRSEFLFNEFQDGIHKRTDRLFVFLMLLQWLGGIVAALVISPKTWIGTVSQTHIHVWAAVFLGGVLTSFPVYLALKRPGQVLTRHVIAVAQMLTSALLIHLTGGRIETHFHVFGSLAFLAFYRDWKVLVSATIVVAIDHFIRGLYWPQSVFGVLTSSSWRWIEHAAWVIFEDIFLFISTKQSIADIKNVSDRQSKVENLNLAIEKKVIERTRDLQKEITEREKAEKELLERKKLLRSTLESTADGILVVNSAGKATHYNEKFKLMWKIPDSLTKTTEDLKLLDYAQSQIIDPDEFLKKVKELYGSDRESLDRIEFKDGRVFERVSIPLLINSKLEGRVWSFRDITMQIESDKQQRELQQQLQRSQRLESLGHLAGGVAHDLNNMLGPVVGYADLLMKELSEDSKAAKKVEKIKKSAEKAAVVIQDLLTLARRGKYEMRIINLNDIINEYLESPSFDNLSKKHPRVELKPKLQKDLGNILGSSAHLEKVLMNLVTNSLEAMSDGGTLDITTEELKTDKGNFVILKTNDTGHGIEEEDMERIFEPFFSKKQMGSSGSGLGLSVVYGIVKDHKGLCDVHSEVGRGTEFALFFPLAQGITTPKKGVQYSIVGGSETILVVDDSPEQREMVHEITCNLGYFVVTAPNGRFAVDFIRAQPVDLVILDMIMESDFDGLDTYKEMLKINPLQKAIIVSGFSESERAQEVLNLGASEFIKKPYNIDRLAGAIRKALDQSQILVT